MGNGLLFVEMCFCVVVCFQGIGKLSMVAQSATKEITAKVICIVNTLFVNWDPTLYENYYMFCVFCVASLLFELIHFAIKTLWISGKGAGDGNPEFGV